MGLPCGVAAVGIKRVGGKFQYFAGRTLADWFELGSRREGDLDRTSRFKS